MNNFFWHISDKHTELKEKISYYLSGTKRTVTEQFKAHLNLAIVFVLTVGMVFSERIRLLCLCFVGGAYFVSLSTFPKRVHGSYTQKRYTPWITYKTLKQCKRDSDYLVFHILQEDRFFSYDVASYAAFKQLAKEYEKDSRFVFVTIRKSSFFLELLQREYADTSPAFNCGIICLTNGNVVPLGIEDLQDPSILEYVTKELEYKANGRPTEFYLGYVPD